MNCNKFFSLLAALGIASIAMLTGPNASATPQPPASNRITIDLSQGVPNFVANTTGNASPQSHWWYENNQDSSTFSTTSYVETAAPASATGPSCGIGYGSPNWLQVGVPNDANIWRSFINQSSGGGQGSVCGQNNWYRLHFKVDPTYANYKVLVEFEGAHTGTQVYINGTLLKGISAIGANANATHVVGFITYICGLTPYIHADGTTDNVLAVSVSRGNSWFEDPQFSEVFRFGQAMAGLYRPVKMFLTNKVHIPANVYSNQKTWGTYVATVSETASSTTTAQAASAVVRCEVNVVNDGTTAQSVTLTNQIVDANGNVVATGTPITQTVNPGAGPSGATPMFDQQITINNPWLWYPNNSIFGTPYLYTVNHIVSVGGTVVDVAQSPLGIRTITWDKNYPYFNGHAMNLWGGSGRYDYPALGSSVPDELQWKDLQLLAQEGGNIWRPGHSASSEEFVNAADELGVMIVQPSGDNEEYFAAGNPSADATTLKQELHRDMIIRDRSHPSILSWESNNGTMAESIGTALLSLNSTWDPINTRVAADRSPDPVNGTLLGCTLEGCEVGIKNQFPNNPAWGSEYWGTGTARGLAWNYELAFVAPFLDNWRKSAAKNCMGMAQWYQMDTPGETSEFWEANGSTTAPGNSNMVRSLGASSMDQNRFPKLLYYAYQAAWTPFQNKPMVKLAGTWNTSGTVQVNAFSNCPAVRLLLNGAQVGSVIAPNPWSSDDTGNQTQTATQIPFQAYWQVPFASGTLTAQGLNSAGNVVCTDTLTTAGAANKIVLSVNPEMSKPDGTNFQITANGSDAAIITAKVVDANGNVVPTAADNLTFSVTGPGTYMGGTQQYVSTNTDAYSNANSTYVNGVPDAMYHSPGDPELQVEGGMTRIAVRSQFAAGTVNVTATAPGLTSGSTSFTVVAVPDPRSAPTNVCNAVPAAPTGLSASVASSSVISIAWSAVTPPTNCSILRYNVFRSTSSTFTPAVANMVASNVTGSSFDDSNLAGSTTYYYAVEAVDSFGSSAASGKVSATTPAGNIPGQVTGFAASYGNALVSLAWGAVSGATSYAVYRGTTPGGESATPIGTPTTNGYADGTVTNGTTYYYQVAAVNANGTGPKSLEASATPSATAPVVALNCGGSAASPFAADADFVGGSTTSVANTISTTGVTNPAPQAVYQSNRYGDSTYTVPGLIAGNSYTVRLHFCETYFTTAGSRTFNVAINGTNVLTNFDIEATAGGANIAVVKQFTATANGSGQIVIAFTTVVNNAQINGIEILSNGGSCSAVPPTGPTTLSATAASSSSINLSWATGFTNPPCTVTGYSVFRSTTNGFAPSTSNRIATNVTTTTYTDTGLAASTTYYYLVETLDSFGASAASPQASATTQAGGTLGAPTNLAATAGNAQVSLTWTAGSGATSYNVYRGTTAGGESTTAIATGITTTSYTNTGLTNGTKYYFTVKSVNSTGTSAASNEASATPATSGGTGGISIDSGGTGVSPFVADVDFTGGTATTFTAAVDTSALTGTIPAQEVLQTNRYGTFSYTIPNLTANTSYPVTLYFSEGYWTAAGKRTFNVVANGTTELTNFDIFAAAGAINKAVSRSFNINSNASGQIVLNINTVIDNGQVNAIVVGSGGGGSAPAAPTNLSATAGNGQVSLSWTASSAATSYNVYRGTTAGGESATAIATGLTGTTYTNTGLTNGTKYYFTVKALNANGTSGASNEASATPAAAPTVQIDCGGAASGSWVADVDFSGGGPVTWTNAVDTSLLTGTIPPQVVLQSDREGVFSYTIPGFTANSTHTVTMYFVEQYWTAAGKRVFNVTSNGTTVLTNVDPYALAGAQFKAVQKSFTTTANASGQIVLGFSASADQPKIGGIAVQ